MSYICEIKIHFLLTMNFLSKNDLLLLIVDTLKN